MNTRKLSLLLFILSFTTLARCIAVPTPAPAPLNAPAAQAPEHIAPPPSYEGRTWADIAAEGRGQTVNWYMWGGSDLINTWVNDYVGAELQEHYDIALNMVPVSDATEFVNKVLGEKQAGKDTAGAVDLVWLNGENFRTMRQADLLYGPWAEFLPNSIYVNWDNASIANDFGFPVDGYESPYGKAQMVLIYDSVRVAAPPETIAALIAWIKANPGKFTYPAPPDFTGSAFVRQICYWATGGYAQFMGDFDQALFDARLPACWDALNELEPYLWRSGKTYPETHARQQDLFANGEVYFDMSYNPAEASSLIMQGKYPATTRTFVFTTGTIANTHYVAIPYNSPHKAAALIVANFLISPAAQLSKAHPDNWGDMPAIDITRLSAEWQREFADLPRGAATLPPNVLAAHQLPELPSAWLVAIERGWEEHVLQQ